MVERELHQRLIQFVRPLYQDLDGLSRFEDVERISAIARHFYTPSGAEERDHFELLLLFQELLKWLERVGNISRTVLMVGAGLREEDLHRVTESLRRLDRPISEAEKALASAMLIDRVGVRGLVSRFAQARREGMSPIEVAREASSDERLPEWLSPAARRWAIDRIAARHRFCGDFLREHRLEDLSSDLSS